MFKLRFLALFVVILLGCSSPSLDEGFIGLRWGDDVSYAQEKYDVQPQISVSGYAPVSKWTVGVSTINGTPIGSCTLWYRDGLMGIAYTVFGKDAIDQQIRSFTKLCGEPERDTTFGTYVEGIAPEIEAIQYRWNYGDWRAPKPHTSVSLSVDLRQSAVNGQVGVFRRPGHTGK